MTRILLVDDQPDIRRAIRQLLAAEYPEALFGEASDGQEALELTTSNTWDLILLDISMPVLGGFEVLKQMRRRRIKTPVLVLSVHSESLVRERALKAGAVGYVTKRDAGRILPELVRKLLSATDR